MATYAPSGLGYVPVSGKPDYHSAMPNFSKAEFTGLQGWSCGLLARFCTYGCDYRIEHYQSFLWRWEVLRFLHPQGPLLPHEVSQSDLVPPNHPTHTLSEFLHWVYLRRTYRNNMKKTTLPPKLASGFSATLSIFGDDENSLANSGKLVYRAEMSFGGKYDVKFFMAAPVFGASCRLRRRYKTYRLLRVSVDRATLRLIQQGPQDKNNHAKSWKAFLAKPIAINGASTRLSTRYS